MEYALSKHIKKLKVDQTAQQENRKELLKRIDQARSSHSELAHHSCPSSFSITSIRYCLPAATLIGDKGIDFFFQRNLSVVKAFLKEKIMRRGHR